MKRSTQKIDQLRIGGRALRPTKRRLIQSTQSTFKSVPKDVWIYIFSFLSKVDDLKACRLVCKLWEKVCVEPQVWDKYLTFDMKYNGMFDDLNDDNKYFWNFKKLKPSEHYAQVTLANFQKSNATLKLLEKWFRKKRWKLLFQTLAPLVNNWGRISTDPTNIERYEPKLFRRPSDEHFVEQELQYLWGCCKCTVSRVYGDMFIVSLREDAARNVQEPSHIILHCDTRGTYLEARTFFGRSRYGSKELSDIHIYYGVRCMQNLWKAVDQNVYGNEALSDKCKKIMCIQPNAGGMLRKELL